MLQPDTVDIVISLIPLCFRFSLITDILSDQKMATFFIQMTLCIIVLKLLLIVYQKCFKTPMAVLVYI